MEKLMYETECRTREMGFLYLFRELTVDENTKEEKNIAVYWADQWKIVSIKEARLNAIKEK